MNRLVFLKINQQFNVMEKFTLKGVEITLKIEAIEVEKGQNIAEELIDDIRAGIATIASQLEQVEETLNQKL